MCVKNAFAITYMPLARAVRDGGATVTDLTEAFIADVLPMTKDGMHGVRAQSEMAELYRSMSVHLAAADVLLLPTLAMPAPAAHDHFIQRGPLVNGEDRWVVAFTVPFNLMSSCPAISLPSGMARTGVPTGLQLVGQPYEDHRLLDIAEITEALLPSIRSTFNPAMAGG